MADGVLGVLDVLFYKILLDSDGLRQITWLVNVKSLGYGHMVAEELERNDREERSQGHECRRHLDVVVDQVLHLLVALGHHSSDTTLAGDDLLHVAEDFLVQLVVGSQKDYRHLAVDKCDRAVLHFGCRISLSMDIRYFL